MPKNNKKDKKLDKKDISKENKKMKLEEEKELKKQRKEKEKNKNIKENRKDNIKKDDEVTHKSHRGKYIFIYFVMFVMLVALIGLILFILNEKFSILYKNPVATIELEEYGTIKVELEPSKAPNTVASFVRLAEEGLYNDTVVYGKDAVSLHFGRGKKGQELTAKLSLIDKTIEKDSDLDYDYEIDGEFENNNFKTNDIKHEKYVLSLVRADYSKILDKIQHYSYNAGTPMFKILIDDAPGMNGNYTAFGKVIEGQDIIDKLAERKLRFEPETKEDKVDLNEFKDFVKIKSITVNTFGRKFKNVETHKKFNLEEYIIQLYEDKF